MDKIRLAIVGCGGMGGRHLLALRELYATELCNVELVAACDVRRDNAEHLADDAERLLGRRPAVFERLEDMVAATPELQAVDITTDAGSHQRVACAAFELGLHVLCEKPLALTVRGCNRIVAAQQRAGKVLSVAENYRRDPMSRLSKALLDAGVIGQPYMFFDISASGGNQIIILPWRHDKLRGGIVIDAGVHNTDMMQYYLGAVHEVYARTQRWEDVRYKPASRGALSDYYARWYDEMPASISATAEDALVSVLSFETGAVGQWTAFYAAHGEGFGRTILYGSRGSWRSGGARNGVPPTVCLDEGGEIKGQALLDLVPAFRLDAITALLFGGERLASYQMPFPEADRKLLAIEYYEFGQCVLTGQTPEVDGAVGRQALAVCYAAFESSLLNRPVTLAEIESEQTAAYESELNAYWGV